MARRNCGDVEVYSGRKQGRGGDRESKSMGQKEGMVVATVVSNRQSSWWLLVVCSRIIRSPEGNYCSNRSLPRH